MSVNGTIVEDKMRRFKGECAHFSFKKCPIYTYDGASVKFSTNSQETNYSELPLIIKTNFMKKKKQKKRAGMLCVSSYVLYLRR
jgi:hypothetical protein